MNKLERIIIIWGFLIGYPLLGLGLYMDKKHPEEEYRTRNNIVKCIGMAPFIASLYVSINDILRRKRLEEEKEDSERYKG